MAVADIQVLLLCSALGKQIHAGNSGSAGADADNLAVLKLLALQLAGIEHAGSGDDCRAVLVIMEYRDLADFLELLKALRSLDVFQVDSAEAVRDVCDGADEVIDSLMLYFNIDGVNIGKTLEQKGLSFHYRLCGQRAEGSESENCGSVGDDCH